MTEDFDASGRENRWAPFENMEGQAAANRAAADRRRGEIAEKVLAIFETPQGQEVLEFLLDRTLRRQVTPRLDQAHLLVSAEQIMPYTLFREGQNSIVADVIALIKIGRERREKNR